MGEACPWYRRAFDWLLFSPVWIAYRLVWLSAWLGEQDAGLVYDAMWKAGLDLPPLAARLPAEPDKEIG